MVNEREDGYEGHEEGEYHFSDDQTGYELEPEAEVEQEAAPAAKASTSRGGAGFKNIIMQYRRAILGVVVFLVLLFVAYKMLIPSSTTQTPEFTEPKAAAPKQAMTPAQPVPAQQPSPVAAPPAMTQLSQPVASTNLPVEQPNPMLAPPAPAPQQQVMQQPPMPAPAQMQQPVAQTTTVTPTQPPAMPVSPPTQQATPEENAMQIMQAEYAQKLADYEAQNGALQTRVKELSKRMANMEATLNQLARMLMNRQLPVSSGGGAAYAPAKPIEPKVAYTVQAIIPGRAWLKSDNGETVTVAEGDLLKDYGRITKIDPYDGVVDIDTGSKTVALSYGAGGD